ncbi:MAG: beta-ketoacyl-ACP synthase II [Bacilli bacterium]|nr:beta-ketoacyl-ACP synthase II [Bacilli bacterium]
MKRVVITGIGLITPIGNTAKETWEGIKNKKCGVNDITLFDCTNFKTKLDAEIKNFNFEDYFDSKTIKRNDRESLFAICCAREAMADSKITKENTDFERLGVFVSTGIGGFTTVEEQCVVNYTKGNKRISPLFIPMGIVNMPAGNVAIDIGAKGESISIVTACASSTHAIGEAYRTIKLGLEDAIIAGGTESAICQTSLAGFENMKALSSATDKSRASIPFDKERNGFVMGEGAGIIILEELEHAKKRNAHIYAEIIGYGATSDAYHITSPDPEGDGASRAMKRAIEDANINPEDIDYINAHGTSTHLNDLTETMAIKKVFGDSAKNVLVSSTKGNTGHLLGAAGVSEAIFCAKALEDGIIPPTINYREKDDECDLNLVVNEVLEKNIKIAMSNSLGFGGHNASILLKKYE